MLQAISLALVVTICDCLPLEGQDGRPQGQDCCKGQKCAAQAKEKPLQGGVIKRAGADPLRKNLIEDTSALDRAYAEATASAMQMAKWGPKDVALSELRRLRSEKNVKAADSGQNEMIVRLLLDMNKDHEAIGELEKYLLSSQAEPYVALHLYLKGKAGQFEAKEYSILSSSLERLYSGQSGWQTGNWPTNRPNSASATFVGALLVDHYLTSWEVVPRALADALSVLPHEPLAARRLADYEAARGNVVVARELLDGAISKSTGTFKSRLQSKRRALAQR